MSVFERKGQGRRRRNRELGELYNEPNVVYMIQSSRKRWAGHVVPMDENELPKIYCGQTLEVNEDVVD